MINCKIFCTFGLSADSTLYLFISMDDYHIFYLGNNKQIKHFVLRNGSNNVVPLD
jgi:hypothetical protein